MNIQRLMQRISVQAGHPVYLLADQTRWLMAAVGAVAVSLHLVSPPTEQGGALSNLMIGGWVSSPAARGVMVHRQFPGVLLSTHGGSLTSWLAQAPIPEDRYALDQAGAVHDQRCTLTRQLGLPDDPLWTGCVPRRLFRTDLCRSTSPHPRRAALLKLTSSPHQEFMLLRESPYLIAIDPPASTHQDARPYHRSL